MADDVFELVNTVVAGAYRVERVVAEGGFGVVYRAYHGGFRAPVALKCLKIPAQFGTKEQAEFLEQFRAEAELLFRLSASIPTVVRPLHVDAVTAPNGRFVPFMALEWLEGRTLEALAGERRKSGKPMRLPELVELLGPVARALEKAHAFVGPEGPVSIVHRDMKPENIFVAIVAGEQVVKILDFGIGKAKSVASQVAGRASQQVDALSPFTPAYGAPEQWLPKRFGQSGPWTDVWGLALSIVETLCGHHVIDGDQAAMMGTAVDTARRPTPRNEGVEVSDAVETVFLKALAVDPRDRYQDAGRFWSDLLTALGRATPASARRVDPRADGEVAARVESLYPQPAASRRVSRDAPTVDADGVAGAAPRSPTPAAIPDLVPAGRAAPAAAAPREEAPPPSVQRGLDLEAAPAPGPAVELDLGLDEPLQRRLTPRGIPAVRVPVDAPPASAGPLRRASSGALPAVGPQRTASGVLPAVSAEPAAPAPASLATPRPRDPTPRPDVARAAPPPPEPTLLQRLAPAVVLIALAIALTLADQAYASSTGQVFTLGPLKAGLVAGLLVLGGVVLAVVRMLPR